MQNITKIITELKNKKNHETFIYTYMYFVATYRPTDKINYKMDAQSIFNSSR